MQQTQNFNRIQTHHKPLLPDQDLLYTILADQKRTTREYCTAALESNCQVVRQMFTELMNDTLSLQGQLYQAMQQNNMYNASSKALRQDVDKQIQSYSQTMQQTQQFLQQNFQ
ncbi:spore coat protein [Tumebacillus sp. ITR2]|uniref:Spore coat protein n=1 Tax=Tumebacillus amylolyticus TaxID=2801339 RepID=A0ABS1JGA2_9BACL|nr:spore coat protein [Tumebacillus amylolyticus]